MHTSSFSDWMSSWDELVQFAGKLWLEEIAITDHSQAEIDIFREKYGLYVWTTARRSVKRWKNVHNSVKVLVGVEWDLLDEDGTCCFHIQGKEGEFLLLSAHKDTYTWDPQLVTRATIKAIERFHDKIRCICHPCNNKDFGAYYHIEELVEAANQYHIPLECNSVNLMLGKTNIEKLHVLLQRADQIYLNSDAHTLYELQEARWYAKQFLREHGYIQ